MGNSKTRILFFIILSIAIGLRLFALDKGYNSDEGWLLSAASLKLNNLIPFLGAGRSVYPPLAPFLLHFWTKVSDSEIWLRSYFVLFGVSLCIVVYFLGRLYLDERFGRLAFFLAAISPMLIWSSHFIRSYIDAAFWAVLSLYFMLGIIKGRGFWKNGLGYILASGLALYTSYINILVLISQTIFVFIFYFKERRFLKKWLLLQTIIFIAFTPCLALLFRQINLATAVDAKWSARGFQLLGLNLGYYARAVVATFGLDPHFLDIHPLAQSLNNIVLSALAVLSFTMLTWVFITAWKSLRAAIKARVKALVWFFPGILILGLISYIFLIEVKNFPFQAEYFLFQHILFIFLIAAIAYPLKGSSRLGVFIFVLLSLIFISRFPEAVKPEFETKKAAAYLADKVAPADCLLILRQTNRYIEPTKFNTAIMFDFLDKSSDADYYQPLNRQAQRELSVVQERYNTVWFYRAYGNDELLGGNKLIMDWLKDNGYIIEDIYKLRRIDIIHYQRGE